MKGRVLAVPNNGELGIIVDAEGARFKFESSAYKAEGAPVATQSVDFDVEGGRAVDIFLDIDFPANEWAVNLHTSGDNGVSFVTLWFSWAGRVSRQDYLVKGLLSLVGAVLVIALIFGMTAGVEGAEGVAFDVGRLLGVGFIWPYFALMAKRFRDIDVNPWFSVLGIVPYLGLIILLVLAIKAGTVGDNRYGPDPLGYQAT